MSVNKLLDNYAELLDHYHDFLIKIGDELDRNLNYEFTQYCNSLNGTVKKE